MNHAKSTANHVPTAATYADAAARTAATGFPRGEGGAIVAFAAEDVGKVARQSDNNTVWMLTATTPTWLQIAGAGLSPGTHTHISSEVTDLASAAPLSPAVVTLTDGGTVTWATAGARINNARITLGGNRTLDITGEVDGATGMLIVMQDGTGGRTLALPAGSKVINTGAGAVTLSTGANAIDILTWIYDGTNFFWTIGTNYS